MKAYDHFCFCHNRSNCDRFFFKPSNGFWRRSEIGQRWVLWRELINGRAFKCDNQIIWNLQDIEQSNRLNTDDFLCQYLLFRFALSPTRKNIFDEISNVLESFYWTNKLVNIYWKFDKYLVPAVTAESQKVKQCLQARHFAILLNISCCNVLHLLFRTYVCKYQIQII